MPEIYLVKTNGNTLIPLDTDSLKGIANGEIIKVKWSKVRNYKFHKKMFALFNFINDALPELSPVKVKGIMVEPIRSLETTRKELVIMAGFYEVEGKIDGSVKLVAKSLSYGSMSNEEFEKVYSALIDVALRVLPYSLSEEELENSINNLVGFM